MTLFFIVGDYFELFSLQYFFLLKKNFRNVQKFYFFAGVFSDSFFFLFCLAEHFEIKFFLIPGLSFLNPYLFLHKLLQEN
jgi:hypothetical protein